MTDITLKEHLSRIATERHKNLKKKLGEIGYSKYMQKISLARFTKKPKLDKTSSSVLE